MTATATRPAPPAGGAARGALESPESVPGSFVVLTPHFSGSLAELAGALRGGTLPPEALDVLALVRDYLVYYREVADGNLELATETLPGMARVVELKVRLLLPRPPKEDEEVLGEVLGAVDLLAGLEEAVTFLKDRREARRVLLSAHAPRPNLPRPERPLRVNVTRLAELAARCKPTHYFELAVERLTVAAAMKGLKNALVRVRRGFLRDLLPRADWPTLVTSFSGMLELVKEGEVRAAQRAPYGPIELELITGEVDNKVDNKNRESEEAEGVLEPA